MIKWNLEFMRLYFLTKSAYKADTGQDVNFHTCFTDNAECIEERSAHIRYLRAVAGC